MIEFLKSNKFKIVIAIIAVLFGMMLFSASSDGASNIPRNLLAMVTAPFQKATAYISNATGSFFDIFLNASNNAKENILLKAEIDTLNQKIVDYEKLSDENEQLKQIAGIKEMYPDFTVATAAVVARDPSDRYSTFTIDKGSLHDISLNDPVIVGNSLVGIVSEVSPINARVKTILSPDLSVSAFEIGSKELGIVSGEIKLAKEGICKLSILSEETVIKSGDMIVTAGSSGKFPKGLQIGKVIEVLNESHGITMYATLMPMKTVENLVDVQVITSFLGQGRELLDYLQK